MAVAIFLILLFLIESLAFINCFGTDIKENMVSKEITVKVVRISTRVNAFFLFFVTI